MIRVFFLPSILIGGHVKGAGLGEEGAAENQRQPFPKISKPFSSQAKLV